MGVQSTVMVKQWELSMKHGDLIEYSWAYE